jgi:tyrosyl-tRNA synthetase
MIQQGAVKVNGEKIGSVNYELKNPGEYLIQVAKRSFVKIIVERKA